MAGRWVTLLMVGTLACDQAPGRRPQDLHSTASEADARGSACRMPAQTTTIVERDGAVLETWALRLEEVVTDELPQDAAFLAYRAAIERDGADVLRPVADPPTVRTEAEAEVWRNEHFNNDLVFRGAVGFINPISCLDALLFSRQASRISQIDRPTEFLASVLRRETSTGPDLVVVFGAGSEMYPPQTCLRVRGRPSFSRRRVELLVRDPQPHRTEERRSSRLGGPGSEHVRRPAVSKSR